MENGLAFVVKRPCVLDETPKRLGANSSAFGVKCTCVWGKTYLRFGVYGFLEGFVRILGGFGWLFGWGYFLVGGA